jgi:UDP-N-acetylglucosamine 2-epimerase
MKKLKIATIIGTRPEIIRLSSTIKAIDKYLNQIIIHTGQNYDYELNEIFFKDLELRKPDFFLSVNTSSLGQVLGDTLIKIEDVFKKEMPDAVLILGDTNSSISGIIAKRMQIPIFHMEAGNRSFDMNVPEEINRRIIDHIADFNLVYTEHARRHLLSEGLPHRRIYLTGSPMREVLLNYDEQITNSNIINKLKLLPNNYFLASIHRQENVDNENSLISIINCLNRIAEVYKMPIIVSTHPRTRKRIVDLKKIKTHKLIQFLKPFGFFDYNKLQKHSKCVISDSGTISEESSILGFPAISLRQSMERPEAQDSGSIILSGYDSDIVLNSISYSIEDHENYNFESIPEEYKITNTSSRVLKLIMGNTTLSNKWWGIN